ncbi:peptidoglycan-binding protein [Priestia aryabhattai]|uniref:peptidoglycan-binding protein n=1 Tax=Priestia aryabhattai TaxID=412384 RepID=UPI0015F5B904|nr:peptidoglycan-binding protein [Priestia aryabhattai]
MVELQYLMDRSEKELVGVHATVADKARELIKKAYDEGIGIAITQGFRSFAEQDALYAIGRTKKGTKVTNAKGGQSIHNYGLAVDFCIFDDNKQPCWTVNKEWKRVVEIAEGLGFESGIHWKFYDAPHLQMTFGLTLAQLKAGKRPAGSATPTVTKKSTLLENGASGSAVKDLQEKLIKLGYELGKVDAQFGKLTDAAVRKFQKDNKLDVDGIAGAKTLAKVEELIKALDAKKEEVKPVEVVKEVIKEVVKEVVQTPAVEKKVEAVKEEVKETPIPKIISLGDKYSFQVKAKKNVVVYGKANLTEKGKTLKKGTVFSVYGYDAEGSVFAVGGGGFVAQSDVDQLERTLVTGGLNVMMEQQIRAFFKQEGIKAQINLNVKGNPSAEIKGSGLDIAKAMRFCIEHGWYAQIKK